MKKEDADHLIAEYEGKKPHSLKLFLEYLDISEKEFNEIVSKTIVAPHKPDFTKDEWSPITADFDIWYREKKS